MATLLNIPQTDYAGTGSSPGQYSGLGNAREFPGARAQAWDAQSYTAAFITCPTNDIQAPFIRLGMRLRGTYYANNVQYTMPDMLATGYWTGVTPKNNQNHGDPWMCPSFQGIGYSFAAIAGNDAGYIAAMNHVQNGIIAPWINSFSYRSANYIEQLAPYNNNTWDPDVNRKFASKDVLQSSGGSMTSVNLDGSGNSTIIQYVPGESWGPFTTDDQIFFASTNWHGDSRNIPTGTLETGSDANLCPSTTLSAAISTTGNITTISVTDATVFSGQGPIFLVLIGKEYFCCTANNNTTLNVLQRGNNTFNANTFWPPTTHSNGATVTATLRMNCPYYVINPAGSATTSWTFQISTTKGGSPIVFNNFGVAVLPNGQTGPFPTANPQTSGIDYSIFRRSPAYWADTPASKAVAGIDADNTATMSRGALYAASKVKIPTTTHASSDPVYLAGQTSTNSTTLGQTMTTSTLGHITVASTANLPSTGNFVVMVSGNVLTFTSQITGNPISFLAGGEYMLASVVDATTLNIIARGNLVTPAMLAASDAFFAGNGTTTGITGQPKLTNWVTWWAG